MACLGESVPSAMNQIMRILSGITLKVPSEGIPLAPWDKMRAVLLVRIFPESFMVWVKVETGDRIRIR